MKNSPPKAFDCAAFKRGGESFRVSPQLPKGSPLDVRGVTTDATTADIVRAVREVRRGGRR